jgi:hypothetical protein
MKERIMNNRETIGGREYAFGHLPALEAVIVEVEIAKVIGEPAFKAFMQLDEKELRTGKVDKQKMMTLGISAVGLLTTKMDGPTLVRVMEMVFKYVTVETERADINKHFTGRNKDLWMVFYHALRFNFSDFFQGDLLGSFLGNQQEE